MKMKMKDKPIAHIRKEDKDCNDPQYLWEHLWDASILAEQFAGKIGLDKSGKLLGLLHDLGKASKEFQNYIRSANGLIDPDEDEYTDVVAKKGKIDHSSAGAQVAPQRCPILRTSRIILSRQEVGAFLKLKWDHF